MNRFKLPLQLGLVLLAMNALTAVAEASHFRYGNISWRRVAGRTVEFTVTTAWRDTLGDPATFSFGDGTFVNIPPGDANTPPGPGYTIRRNVFSKTYTGDGPYTASFNSCCRISTLKNAADASFREFTVVNLSGQNNGSPVTASPVILQMPRGFNTVPLAIADPQGHPYTCRLATFNECLIPTQPATLGKPLQVSTSGVLTWDTSGTAVGDLYAAAVVVEETNGSSTMIDFIIQIVGGTVNSPPTITSNTVANGSSHTVVPGQTFTGTFTYADPNNDSLTVSHAGLPQGATLSPPAGTTVQSGSTVTFSWTPQTSQRGQAFSVNLSARDPGGLDANYGFSLRVPDNNKPEVKCPTPVSAEQQGAETSVTLSSEVRDADGDELHATWNIDGVNVRTDVVPAGASVNWSTLQLTSGFGPGTYVVTLTVTDGQESHACSATVTVRDTTRPSFVINAENISVPTDPGKSYATNVNLGLPTVIDNSGAQPTLTNDAPAVFPYGTTTVTWTATDAAGNSSTTTQTVTVVDREAPSVTPPADIQTYCDTGEPFATVGLGTPTVSDNVDPSPTVVNNAPAVFAVGTSAVEWIVTDASGNQTIAVQHVTVVNRAPVADAGPDQTLECTSPQGAEVTLDATGSSDADGHELTYHWSAVGITFDDDASPTPKATFPIGTTIVTLHLEDEAGAHEHANVLIIVEDTTAPTINIIEVDTGVLSPPNHKMVPVKLYVSVNDACELPQLLNMSVVVRSSEPDDTRGDGTSTGDVNGQDGYTSPVSVSMTWNSATGQWEGTINLRAERSGLNSAGRKYSIYCTAADHHGNVTQATVCVVVPHDKRK